MQSFFDSSKRAAPRASFLESGPKWGADAASAPAEDAGYGASEASMQEPAQVARPPPFAFRRPAAVGENDATQPPNAPSMSAPWLAKAPTAMARPRFLGGPDMAVQAPAPAFFQRDPATASRQAGTLPPPPPPPPTHQQQQQQQQPQQQPQEEDADDNEIEDEQNENEEPPPAAQPQPQARAVPPPPPFSGGTGLAPTMRTLSPPALLARPLTAPSKRANGAP